MADDRQQKYRQFLDLLPLTLSLAGLAPSEPGKHFLSEQIESRAMTIKHAYKAARLCVKELLDS